MQAGTGVAVIRAMILDGQMDWDTHEVIRQLRIELWIQGRRAKIGVEA